MASLNVRVFAISLLLTLVFYLSGFFVFLTPLPLVYVMRQQGRVFGLFLSLLSALFLFGLYVFLTQLPELKSFLVALPGSSLSPLYGISGMIFGGMSYFVYYLIIAWGLGEVSHRRLSINQIVLVVTGLVIFSALALALLLSSFTGVDILVESRSYLLYIMDLVFQQGAHSGLTGEQLHFLEAQKEVLVVRFLTLLPAILSVGTVSILWVVIVVSRRWLPGRRIFDYLKPLPLWKTPDLLIWFLIGSGALYFVNLYLLKEEFLGGVLANALIVLVTLYAFQGLAVVVSFLGGLKAKWLRLAAYLAILFFFQAAVLVMMLFGVFDFWFDFRKFAKKQQN